MLSMSSTKAWAQAVILKKNDPAPFTGVLMPEGTVRELKSDHDYNKYLLEKKDVIASQPLISESKSTDTIVVVGVLVLAFAFGFSVGNAKK